VCSQVEVVGVVAHQHTASLAEPGREEVYVTDAFLESGRVRSWAIRTGSDTPSDEGLVRRTIKAVNPSLVVNEMETMDTVVDHAQDNTRFSLLLIALFALIAGVLAGLGLYGVLRRLCDSALPRSACAWPWERGETIYSRWSSARDSFSVLSGSPPA
jgi:hypothetical protein